MSTPAIYDEPGPRGILRNRLLAAATLLVLAGILAFVLMRFQATGQFEARRWSAFGYTSIWEQIGKYTLNTVKAFALAAVLALALGFALAVGRMSDHKWVAVPTQVFLEIFRAVPVLILMMLMYYGLPTIGANWVSPYVAVVASLTVYNGAVIAEAIRAGVLALPGGQGEAGYALGLRKYQVMSLILLPQAVRSMLPVIIAQLVVVLKDTALGFIITYPELLDFARTLGSRPELGNPIIPSAIVIGAIYVGMCLAIAGAAKLVEKRINATAKSRGEDVPDAPETTLGIIAAPVFGGEPEPAPDIAETR